MIRNRVKEHRKNADMSQEALALEINSTKSTISKIERGIYQLTHDMMVRIAKVLKVRPTDLIAESEGEAPSPAGDAVPTGKKGAFGPDTVPIMGQEFSGSDAVKISPDNEIGTAPRHPGQHGAKKAFAIYVPGKTMGPKYEPGELVYLITGPPPKPGDDVLVELSNNDGFLKRLEKITPTEVVCQQFNPQEKWARKLKDVKRVHIVVGTGGKF
jgi:transcriptional regulator with XRE-family HTH domain